MSPSFRGPFTKVEMSLVSLNTFVFLVGIIGNAMVIKTFYAKRDQPGSRYVLVLAIVDLITSFWIPVIVVGVIINNISENFASWPFGKFVCYLQPTQFSLFATSAWLLVAICLERVR